MDQKILTTLIPLLSQKKVIILLYEFLTMVNAPILDKGNYVNIVTLSKLFIPYIKTLNVWSKKKP